MWRGGEATARPRSHSKQKKRARAAAAALAPTLTSPCSRGRECNKTRARGAGGCADGRAAWSCRVKREKQTPFLRSTLFVFFLRGVGLWSKKSRPATTHAHHNARLNTIMADSDSDDGTARSRVGWLLLGVVPARRPVPPVPPPVFLALEAGKTVLKSDDG